ncbi:MAG TPA: allophanate hydrolase subunit 1 [Jatrophihabitans sp.]|nr:allophanate hydrolase subunit 1 [Jatrophihabitans sp.]
MRVLDYGDRAVLVETADPLSVRAAVLGRHDPAVLAVVPAAASVLIQFDRPSPALRSWLDQLPAAGPSPAAPAQAELEPLRLPVRYDGPDLAAVAGECGLTVAELIHAHSSRTYTVQFCGFAPGFGYLTGLDPRLRVSRLVTPRTRVPAGSVAIADEFTGVYPGPSPGGWRLLGSTGIQLLDLDRRPPALLQPGRQVTFVPQ